MKFTMPFAITWLFYHKESVIFNTSGNVYQCCKTPCLNFRAHHENFVSICCHLQNGIHIVHILYRAKEVVVKGYHIQAVNRMMMKSPSHFCECLTCAQAGVRTSTVMEEGIYHVLVTMNSTDVLHLVCLKFPCRTCDVLQN
jgi:hypothetical protein